MFEWCSIPVIRISSPGLERAPAPALGHEVDPLGRAAGEDDLAGRRRVEKPRDPRAHAVVGHGGTLAQVVDAPVDVGVLGAVEPADGVDDGTGLLAGGGVVEVDQRLAAHLLRQDREILAQLARRRASGVAVAVMPAQRPPRRSSTRRSSSSRTGASATSSTTSAAKA